MAIFTPTNRSNQPMPHKTDAEKAEAMLKVYGTELLAHMAEAKQVTPALLNAAVEDMQAIASSKGITDIEKRIKIIEYLSGKYVTPSGHQVIVYRSPANQTLFAMRGPVFGENIIKSDLTPMQVIKYLTL